MYISGGGPNITKGCLTFKEKNAFKYGGMYMLVLTNEFGSVNKSVYNFVNNSKNDVHLVM